MVKNMKVLKKIPHILLFQISKKFLRHYNKMSKNYLIDYNFGIESENNIIHALQTHFNDDSIIKLNKCHTFDFKGQNVMIVMKFTALNQPGKYNNYNQPTEMTS